MPSLDNLRDAGRDPWEALHDKDREAALRHWHGRLTHYHIKDQRAADKKLSDLIKRNCDDLLRLQTLDAHIIIPDNRPLRTRWPFGMGRL